MRKTDAEIDGLSPEQRQLLALLLDREGLDVSLLTAARDEATLPEVGATRLAPARVLLTGATGYLGVYLLRELLRRTEATVYCLVRAGSDAEAHTRVAEQLKWHFPDDDFGRLLERVAPLRGDIGLPQLGLAPETYRELCSAVDFVYHAAADVRHIGDPAHFHGINVEGTRAVLAFAQEGREKALHHVSTTLVAGSHRDPSVKSFREHDFDVGQDIWPLPYVQSKFAAERLVREASARGSRAVIHRVGAVAADSQTGRFQRNIGDNMLYGSLRAVIDMGAAPYLPGISFDIIPADFVAAAIVSLSQVPHPPGQTFHHVNPHRLAYDDLIRTLQALGFSIRLLDYDEYVGNLDAFDPRGDHQGGLLSFSAFANTAEARPLEINSSFTQRWLRQLRLECPRVTPAWLRLVLRHCIEVGYIRPPAYWAETHSVPPLFS